MGNGNEGTLTRRFRVLLGSGPIGDLSDGQLLERFVAGRGDAAAESAFAALVERHGPVVLRIARGVLADPNDAHDAFQATFLVLVARARGLWVKDSLGPWLHRVAHRTAKGMRSAAARRRRLDRRIAPRDAAEWRPDGPDRDAAALLLEEVDRLPERFRLAVVLCDLEGRTHEQAARELGWPVGTVKSRQARARDRLRDRLARRGAAPALAALPRLGLPVPTPLIESTTVAAARFLASRAVAPGPAAALARGVLRTMTTHQAIKVAALGLTLGLASGAALIAQGPATKPSPGQPPAAAPAPQPDRADGPPVITVEPGRLTWTIKERGVLEAAAWHDGASVVPGETTLLAILPDGSAVRKGDQIAELDATRLRERLMIEKLAAHEAVVALRRAETAHEAARAALAEWSEVTEPLERKRYRAAVDEASERIDIARARRDRIRKALNRVGGADRAGVGAETPASIVAGLDLADRLDAADAETHAAERGLKLAELQAGLFESSTLPRTAKRLGGEVEQARADAAAQESAMNLRREVVEGIMNLIEACVLRATVDGVVSYPNRPANSGQPAIEPGMAVRERQVLFTLYSRDAPLRVNASVHESIVDRIVPGQAVRVRVDAAGNSVEAGVVETVAPMADRSSFRNGGKKIYPTRVALKGPNPMNNLRPGMTAAVEIDVVDREGVLAVPMDSVILVDGRDHVAVRRPDGGTELRAVTLGANNETHVEIKEGLRPGEQILRDPPQPVGGRTGRPAAR